MQMRIAEAAEGLENSEKLDAALWLMWEVRRETFEHPLGFTDQFDQIGLDLAKIVACLQADEGQLARERRVTHL